MREVLETLIYFSKVAVPILVIIMSVVYLVVELRLRKTFYDGFYLSDYTRHDPGEELPKINAGESYIILYEGNYHISTESQNKSGRRVLVFTDSGEVDKYDIFLWKKLPEYL